MAKNKIEKADLADFVNRKQSPNESKRQYAEALERLAKHVFQKMQTSELEAHLEKTLMKGLFNVILRKRSKKCPQISGKR